MKYPILAKSITLIDGGTRLPELSAAGQMSQDIQAGKTPFGEIILEVWHHHVAIFRERHGANGAVVEGEFERLYLVPNSQCRVERVQDNVQPEHLQTKPPKPAETEAPKRPSVVIAPKPDTAPKAQKE